MFLFFQSLNKIIDTLFFYSRKLRDDNLIMELSQPYASNIVQFILTKVITFYLNVWLAILLVTGKSDEIDAP